LFNFIYLGKKGNLKVIDESDDTANSCLEWRMKYWDGFETKFKGTLKGTKKWITESILGNPKRILFLITYDGQKIGHVGLDGYDEMNNSIFFVDFMRGVRGFAPGLMSYIEKKFIHWIFTNLKILTIQLRVFSDNYKTINLHERCGFLTVNSIPLKRNFTKDGWNWSETKIDLGNKYAERYFSIMEKKKTN